MLIEVADAEVLAKTVVNTRLLGGMHKGKPLTGIYAFTRNGVGSGNDIRARMYAPLQGINEDPATGSAACVLSAVLGNEQQRDGKHKLLIEQGIEMSRPSHLSARATIQGGSLNAIHLYGQCVDVMHGKLKT